MRMRRKRAEGKKIAINPSLQTFVEDHLMDDQSPEALAGRLANIERDIPTTSASAIRAYIKSVYGRRIEIHRNEVFKKRRRRRVPKTSISGKRMISSRPKRIHARKGLGHMEGDFIVSGRSGKGMLLALTDRKTRKSLLERILPVSVANVQRALLRMKKRYPEMQTITFDNDILFLEHQRLEQKLAVTIFFCHPHSPWEKGGIENLNKWLRRYIPKSSDISKYSKYSIAKLEAKANRRFMECLKFLTPDEAYEKELQQKKRLGALRKKSRRSNRG